MTSSITAFDGKTHFSKLLNRVIKGEEVLITKRGKITAKIVPVNATHDVEAAIIAANRIKKLAQEINLQPSEFEEWNFYRKIGRK
ncbi:type II toxin-antitoxin system prevent-host-death family antitoxin [Rickettsia endosymbiont of Seladonia tumulorum]|uniref:type II toxin-antitoxin system Phd/YefM family antitoxin n=1 Tax=Rickettsia endosymbiont of Seladonia tumulorum TaxID=3066270 RepID=UPI00313C83DB